MPLSSVQYWQSGLGTVLLAWIGFLSLLLGVVLVRSASFRPLFSAGLAESNLPSFWCQDSE